MFRHATSPALVLLLALGGSACGGDAAPTIALFSASAMNAAPGRMVTLTWSVEGADRIALYTHDELARDVELATGLAPAGSTPSRAINSNTSFELRAWNGEERASAFVDVTVSGGSAVRIIRFDASSSEVKRGEALTLSWSIENAVRGQIRIVNGAIVADSIALPSGSIEVTPSDSATYQLVAEGPSGPVTASIDIEVSGPKIQSFRAEPASILRGETGALVWIVQNATMIEIRDGAGDTVYTGDLLLGSVGVAPIATTDYTLYAADAQGTVVNLSTTLLVNEPVRPTIISFDATPPAVDIGTSSALSWRVTDARDVVIQAASSILTTTTELAGAEVVTPTITTSYELIATSAAGEARRSVIVTVNPSPPAIRSFVAQPNPGPIGGSTSLEWSVLGADRLIVEKGSALVYETAIDVGSGALLVDLTETSTSYTLRAANAIGTVESTINVLAGPLPIIDTFSVSPQSFMGTTTATITYSTQNAIDVILRINGLEEPAFPGGPSGTFASAISQTTLFELVASNAVGSVSESTLVSSTAQKNEPNDTAATAVAVTGAGGIFAGTIGGGDVDWYSVQVPAGGSIVAETSDGAGSCAVDTVLELYGSDETTLLHLDNDSGPGPCSRIDPFGSGVFDLAAGAYYLRVSAGILPGPYALFIAVSPDQCGNGLREVRGGEQCDDGGAVSGDGCDATCAVEANAELAATTIGANVTLTRSISPIGDTDYFRVDMPVAGFLIVETFAPALRECTADTVLALFDASFTELGEDDDSGPDACSLMHPTLHAFAQVSAGTYYLRVDEKGNDAEIPAYVLRIRTRAPGCGNGVLEPGETCDDSDVMSADGCSATCQVEGQLETEPNDTFQTADATPLAGTELAGMIAPAGDRDFYSVIVPAEGSVYANLHDGQFACTATGAIDSVIALYGTDGTTLLGNNDDGGVDLCSRIDPVIDGYASRLTAGTYFVEVRTFDAGSTGRYELELFPIAPSCGNGIIESGEQCDDGDTLLGDGCNATCRFEIVRTVSTSSAAVMISLPSLTAFGIVRVVVPAGRSIEAIARDPLGGCVVDTGLGLADASFQELGFASTGGPGPCAAITVNEAFALALSAGNYYLLVFNEGSTAGDVLLEVFVRP